MRFQFEFKYNETTFFLFFCGLIAGIIFLVSGSGWLASIIAVFFIYFYLSICYVLFGLVNKIIKKLRKEIPDDGTVKKQ